MSKSQDAINEIIRAVESATSHLSLEEYIAVMDDVADTCTHKAAVAQIELTAELDNDP